MRKLFLFLVFLLIACMTISCADSTNTQIRYNSTTNDNIENVSSFEQNTYSFNSYEDLSCALYNVESEQYKKLHNDAKSENYGERFDSFLEYFEAKNGKLLIPCLNGDPMTVKSKYEWQKITLFTNELYSLPWIWYYCDYNGETIVVCTAYIDAVEDITISGADSFKEAIKKISPITPVDISELKDNEAYKQISDVELNLFNNIKVSAVRYDTSSNGRTRYNFLLDGCFVSIWAYNSEFELSDEFFSGFSLQIK